MTAAGRDQRGGAAIEFALLAPILALLMVGVLEVGRLADAAMIARNAAREAARYAAVGDQPSSGVSYQQRALTYLNGAFAGQTGVTLPTSGQIVVTTSGSLPDVQVQVRVPVTVAIPIPVMSKITGATVQLWGDATMRVAS